MYCREHRYRYRSFCFNKEKKLKYSPGCYPAYIDRKNRLVYKEAEDCIILVPYKDHYKSMSL